MKTRRIEEIEFLQSLGPSSERISRSQLRRWKSYELLTFKIFLREKIQSWHKPPVAFGESRIGVAEPTLLTKSLKLDYDYQRNGLPLDAKNPFLVVYPGSLAAKSWQSRALFAGSCQAALATVLQSLKKLKPDTCFGMGEEPYWETIDLIREMGFPVRRGHSKPRGKNGVLFYDTSTEVKNQRFQLSSFRGWDWLLIDTSCAAQSSRNLNEIISQALGKKIPVLLIRSHQKLDSLGIEYNRLGSIVLLWDDGFSEKKKIELERFWLQIGLTMRLMGTGSQLRQWYPFLESRKFQALNERRNRGLQLNNQAVAAALQGVSSRDLRLVQFEHNYFFLIVCAKKLSAVDIRSYVTSFLKLCQLSGLCSRWIASYAWDFVGITAFPVTCHFFAQMPEGTAFRLSLPELDLGQRKLLISVLKQWCDLLQGQNEK